MSYIKEYELIQTLREHELSVCQVIEISKSVIISCGLDGKMNIWKAKDNKFNCINTLLVNDEPKSSTNILKINENEIVSAATRANYIIFWNSSLFPNGSYDAVCRACKCYGDDVRWCVRKI